MTGGQVYRGAALPEWQGIYIYGDFCSGQVWGLLQVDGVWQSRSLFFTGAMLSSFGTGEDGAFYYADYNSNNIYRLTRR